MKPILSIFVSLVVAKVYNEHLTSLNIKMHFQEEKVVLQRSLKEAVDVTIRSDDLNEIDICQTHPKTLYKVSQELSFFQQFNDSQFDFDSNLRLQQFVFMTHVHDGLLAVTSNRDVYLLKFNYSWMHNTQYQDLENQNDGNFVNLVWKSNLTLVTPPFDSINEIPQLFFSEQFNLGFIAYTYELLVFNVEEIDQNIQDVLVFSPANFVKRKARGWTKSQGQIIYSAAGSDGLDIYYLNVKKPYQVTLLKNIKAEDVFHYQGSKISPFIVNDFSLKQADNNDTLIYIMEETRGIVILRVHFDNSVLQVKLLMHEIGPLDGGMALDTYDGESVFGIYKINNVYHAMEFNIQLPTQTWELFQTYTSRKKIADVKVNEDFAVLQGMNYHRIVFYGIKPQFKPHSKHEILNFEHMGLRDFDFFKPNLSKAHPRKPDSQFSNLDSFIFGVTSQKIFVMKYFISTPFISCVVNEVENITLGTFKYNVQFNTSTCQSLPQRQPDSICQNEMAFTIQLVSTYLYKDRVIVVFLTIGSFVVLFLAVFAYFTYQYIEYRKTHNQLSNELTVIKSRSPSESRIQYKDNQLAMESPQPRD